MAGATQAKVIVLGSGPAGATAAIYAARAMLEPVMIAGLQPGGQLTITTDVENYPGFAETIQGPWLMEQMQTQAEHVGTRVVQDAITSVDLGARPFTLIGDSGAHYRAETLIIATGAQAKWLGLETEERFKGFGVSACATCDGFFFRGKRVAVVGGGNTAAEEALFLTNFAEHVTLVHRRSVLRADKTNQLRLASNAKIAIRYDSVVDEIIGHDDPKGVEGIPTVLMSTNNELIGVLRGYDFKARLQELEKQGQSPSEALGHLNQEARSAKDTTTTSIVGASATGGLNSCNRTAPFTAGLFMSLQTAPFSTPTIPIHSRSNPARLLPRQHRLVAKSKPLT